MSKMKTRVVVGLGVVGLAMLGGCGSWCYPNLKSVEPQYEPEEAASVEARGDLQLVRDGEGHIMVVARDDN